MVCRKVRIQEVARGWQIGDQLFETAVEALDSVRTTDSETMAANSEAVVTEIEWAPTTWIGRLMVEVLVEKY